MNREFLKGLGLEDEAIDKIMTEHGKSLNDYKDKADKHDGLVTQVRDLKEQLKERDTQLEDLKKVDADALQKTIDDLQETNKEQKTEYEEKLQRQSFDFNLERALVNANVHNPKAVKALLNVEGIKLDGEKLLGLDAQLEALKKSDQYLFKQEETPGFPQIVPPGNPNGGGNSSPNPFSKEHWNLTEQGRLLRDNPELYKHLKAHAGK